MADILLLLFPRLNPKDFCASSEYRSRVLSWLGKGVGGFVLFGGSWKEVVRAINDLRERTTERLVFAVDAEFGLPMRFEFGTRFPSMAGLGQVDDVELTEQVAKAIGLELREVGIDWNLAPVLDVNVEPRNPIINIRSFGTDPARVSAHGSAYIKGLRSAGVLSCGKHFPGHGRTVVDSHIDLPAVDANLQDLEACDFQPFRAAIADGVDSIMTGHLRVPSLGADELPASLSNAVVARLRDELGFEGLVITDALDMGGALTGHANATPEVAAFLAGNDIMEIPGSVEEAISRLSDATRDNAISRGRINESLGRRRRALEKLDQLREGSPSPRVDREAHAQLARDSAARSLRIEDNRAAELSPADRVALVTPEGYRGSDRIRGLIGQEWPDLRILQGAELFDRYRDEPDFSGTIWIASIQPTGGAGTIELPDEISALWTAGNPGSSTLVNLGTPYLGTKYRFARRIDTFSDGNESVIAAMLRVLSD